MKINILTLFPNLLNDFFKEGVISKALEKEVLEIEIINIRDYSENKHKKVDDYPFGGGPGMVLSPEPIYKALKSLLSFGKAPLIYFTPQGKLIKQKDMNCFSKEKEIILLCGHYKEIDQRIRDLFVDYEFSIGDYVLSGGEIPALVFVDAVSRMLDDILGDINSAYTDSFFIGGLGYPCYTRPREFLGQEVPEVLLSGNHKEIRKWESEKSMELTKKNRPDLLEK
eukprot:TRINITY_DN18564_c0_g1_i1.p1 TRINITY_DN18564_c0_g1~~TRINITY_DN18564_c0_g1_i1.p1  ORF type:complete len:225 (-),score=52.78 TRINITY_DN18564_c0_g1_i1:203-877(-)